MRHTYSQNSLGKKVLCSQGFFCCEPHVLVVFCEKLVFANQHGTTVRVVLAIDRLVSKQTQVRVDIKGGNDDLPSEPSECDHECQKEPNPGR